MPKAFTTRLTCLLAALLQWSVIGLMSGQTLTPDEEAAQKQFIEKKEPRTRIAIYGWVEASITGNPAGPSDHQNFGRLFDDRSNEGVMNQAVITAERTLQQEKKHEFDWGFKAQLLFGTDARYIRSLGNQYDEVGTGLYQGDVPEVYLNLHFPIITDRGLDLKLGKFVTLEGAETIDPRTNPFYSHTYIFNFGIPATHTGALFTLHTTDTLDLFAGPTRGVNTGIDDNNDAPAFHGGFSATFSDGKGTLVASTHIGPETVNDNTDLRYLSDVTMTWKLTEKLTWITDFNYTVDGGARAEAYGLAQYYTYAINDTISVGIRGEMWRDDQGFYVAQYADPMDPIRVLGGDPAIDPRTVGAGRTTYGALTLGADIKLSLPKPLAGLRFRPEIRVDHSFNDTYPFNDSTDNTMYTAALDAILTF